MESTLTNMPNGEAQLTVTVPHQELLTYIDKAERELAKDLKVDGFRKGKVPHELAKKQLGAEAIREAALDFAVRETLAKAIQEKTLDVLHAHHLSVKENSAELLSYQVTLRLFPDIQLPDLASIHVPPRDVSISDKEVTDALEVVQSSRASFADKTTPAEKGDRLEVDFDVFLEGKLIEGGSSKNHPVVLGNNNFMPGFEDQLIGSTKGQTKDFSLVAPADYFNKELSGKKLDFKVTINDVKAVIKPELTDAFAQTLGRFAGMDDLMENVRAGLLEEKRSKEKQKMRIEALAEIHKRTTMTVPTYLIDERLDDMIASFDNDLHQRGMELALYLAHVGKTQDDIRKEWRGDAERQAGYALLIQKIAKEKNIHVSEQEVEEGAAQKLQAIALSGEARAEDIDVEKLRNAVSQDMVNEKTLQYIEETCIHV